jgi:hypothetical protein
MILTTISLFRPRLSVTTGDTLVTTVPWGGGILIDDIIQL